MDVIGSNLRTADPDFRDNQARMEALVRDLKDRLAQARAGGGERTVELHRSRGKMLARERSQQFQGAQHDIDRSSPDPGPPERSYRRGHFSPVALGL